MEENAFIIDHILPLWNNVEKVWNHGLLGIDIGSLIIALLIMGGFLILREFIGRFILRRMADWAIASKNKIDDKIIPALIPPANFVPVILGIFFAGQALQLEGNAEIFFDRAIRSLIAFTIFWAVYLAIEPLSHSMKRLEKLLTPMMTQWIFKVMRMLVLFVGAAVILEIWGIEVGPMLAGLGLFGAAIALGAQDFFKNLIAGMSIISEKRFHDGDWILVEGVVEGTVEDIGFRSTTVRRFDKAPIYVPNSKLADAVVTNFSRMTHRQIKWRFGVSHKTSVEQLKQIRDGILKYLTEKSERFAQSQEAGLTVRVDSFSNTSIDFVVNCFTKATDYDSWMEAREALAFKIKRLVEESGTSFATTTPSVYVGKAEEAEIFLPPENAKRKAV